MLRLHSSSAQAHFLCDFKHRSTTNLPSFLHHSVTFAPRDHHKACFSEHPPCFARIARGYSTTVSTKKHNLNSAARNPHFRKPPRMDASFVNPFTTADLTIRFTQKKREQNIVDLSQFMTPRKWHTTWRSPMKERMISTLQSTYCAMESKQYPTGSLNWVSCSHALLPTHILTTLLPFVRSRI